VITAALSSFFLAMYSSRRVAVMAVNWGRSLDMVKQGDDWRLRIGLESRKAGNVG
jgi:hypothetical protein